MSVPTRKAPAGGCSGTRPFFVGAKGPITGTILRVVVLGTLAATGCTPKQPLANTYKSAEALASAVLEAVRAGDRARLDALALSEQEFQDHVWPELPAARPERNLPLSYVWGDLQQKSAAALANTVTRQAVHSYELRGVTFSTTTPYAGYRVHRDAVFRVQDATGTETDIRLCGSMIERDGGWKVFSYVID